MVEHGATILASVRRGQRELEAQTSIKRGYLNLIHAREAIARLKAHRLQREAKVMAAMRARPGGQPQDWVELAYDDVPPRMWPVAERSLVAHVQRIQALGLV